MNNDRFDPTNFDPEDYGDAKPMCDPGLYICIPTWMKRTDERRKPQIDFHVQPIISIATGEVVSESVSTIFETATLTSKAVWRFANMCQAIGTGRFNANSNRDVQEKILGRPFKAKIVADTYQGKERRRFGAYLRMSANETKMFEKWEEDNALGAPVGDNFDPTASASTSSSNEGSWGEPNRRDVPTSNDGDFSDDDIPF